MDYTAIFSISLIVFGVVFGALSICVCYALLCSATKLACAATGVAKWEKIPRSKTLGVIFAIAAIVWCVPQAISIFSAGSASWIIPVAVLCFIIGCFFLDYLFARALAGFLILLSHYFLLESFAADLPYLWIFSSACYVMGTFGIVIGAFPYLLRDLIRKIHLKTSWKIGFAIIFALYGLLGIATGILLLMEA